MDGVRRSRGDAWHVRSNERHDESYFEETTRTFVLRVWKESREIKGASPTWRGMIQHVSTGERRYFADAGELTRYLERHLDELGFRAQRRIWRLVRKLRWWRPHRRDARAGESNLRVDEVNDG